MAIFVKAGYVLHRLSDYGLNLRRASVAAWVGLLAPAPAAYAAPLFDGFVRYGDLFPQAALPMTPAEQQIYRTVQDAIEETQRAGAGDSEHYRRGVNKNSLISVKISATGNLLINLKPGINLRHGDPEQDPFFTRLVYQAVMAADKLGAGASWQPADVRTTKIKGYVVLGGKTILPHEYLQVELPGWVVLKSVGARERREPFLHHGYFFDAAYTPMTPFERAVFNDLQGKLKRFGPIHYDWGKDEPGLDSASLLSVKVSKYCDLLVNIKSRLYGHTGPEDDSNIMHYFGESLRTALTRQLGLFDSMWNDKSFPEFTIRYVYDGMDLDSEAEAKRKQATESP